MAIEVTEIASKEITRIAQEQEVKEDYFLRLGIKGGGCSGFTYLLDITVTKGENDEEFESNGVKIICDPKSYLYLNGTTVDFKDEIMGRGFVFRNPNANNSCGCGSSFSV